MSLALLIAAVPLAAQDAPAPPEGYSLTWHAPAVYVRGQSYLVHFDVEVFGEDVSLPGVLLSPGRSFLVNGAAVAEDAGVEDWTVPKGTHFSLGYGFSTDLDVEGDFEVAFLPGFSDQPPVQVRAFRPAEALDEIDFMKAPAAKLASCLVSLDTEGGEVLLELWPDVAPRHVRNFLDLCYTGFYDGTRFHRTSLYFAQGGCPNTKTDDVATWGHGEGPRYLDPERSDRKHVRGVISMARGMQADSASSQFFVLVRDLPSLDGEFSAFGKLLSGMGVVTEIAEAPSEPADDGVLRPVEPRKIERALVLLPLAADVAEYEPTVELKDESK